MVICMTANTYGSDFFRNMRGRLSSPSVSASSFGFNIPYLLEYFIPTGCGASGAAIYDAEGRMIGLHISASLISCVANLPPTWPNDWVADFQELSIQTSGFIFQGLPLIVVPEELSRLCQLGVTINLDDMDIFDLCHILYRKRFPLVIGYHIP
ncbi:hypothetical protein RND81_03G019700 [Saponaria officinalis]|uniref:Uncharacterized protein n=1 Tax=Saponaria officinalis TaxID=3572 RepID=A0AAW1LXV6_SAPOF